MDELELTFDLATTTARSKRHGSPREGASLAGATELRGKPVREAVAALAGGMFPEKMEEVFLQTFPARPELERNVNSLPMRAAWNLVSICLTARSSGQCLPRCGIHEAEVWFRGGLQTTTAWLSAQIPAESLWQAEQLLNGIQLDSEFRALLPYILEEHGPGSRASVMKDPATASSRAAKREGGVFYTPADVADYMVEHARKLYSGDFLTAKSLDPACGTGVFSLAMLRSAIHQHHAADDFSRLDYITSCLHGFPLAADFICQLRDIGFVLVNEIVWSKDGTGGKWGSHGKQRPIFGSYPYPPNFLFKNVHEYIVIVAKPPEKKANGKTVVSYDYLLGKSKNRTPKGNKEG
jgi:hypothetical protein